MELRERKSGTKVTFFIYQSAFITVLHQYFSLKILEYNSLLPAQVENKYWLLNFSLCKHKFIVSRKIPYCAFVQMPFCTLFLDSSLFSFTLWLGYFLFSHSGFSAFSKFSTMITYYFYNQQKTNLRIVHINIPLKAIICILWIVLR